MSKFLNYAKITKNDSFVGRRSILGDGAVRHLRRCQDVCPTTTSFSVLDNTPKLKYYVLKGFIFQMRVEDVTLVTSNY